MAIIYPKNYDLNVIKSKSESEAIILKMFSEMDVEKTKDWKIYYSYIFKGKEKSKSNEGFNIKINNEIDFLILAPDVGFFVFEIKGGDIIYTPEEGYITLNRATKSEFKITPYKQAKENYYGLKELLKELYKELNNKSIMFDSFVGGTLVGFPDITKIPTGGLESDGNDTYVGGMNLYEFIMRNSSLLKQRKDKIIPTKKDVEIVEKKLLGSEFYYSMNEKDYIDSVNLAINNLTEEQSTTFKGLLNNKRCLIKGKAGTGKTILCEFLYKYLTEEKKLSVIYFTYNKLIAERLNYDLKTTSSSKCYPIIEYLENEYRKYNDDNIPLDFEEKKKFLFESSISILDKRLDSIKYDCLIIDEAQDIDGNENTLMFFDYLLNDGLENGYCYIFYDKNQTIFNPKNKKIYELEEFGENHYRYCNFELIRNCRNSMGIKQSLDVILENTKSNSLYNIKDELINEDTKYYEISNSIGGAQVIKDIIKDLIKKGIKRKQITILFNRSEKDNIILNELQRTYNNYFIRYTSKRNDVLTYSTVSAFKGLENDIIIYVNDNFYSKSRDHYVAISRSKVLGYIFKVL